MAYNVEVNFMITCTDANGDAVFSDQAVDSTSLGNYIKLDVPLALSASSVAVSGLIDLTSKDYLVIIPATNISIELATGGTAIEIPAGFPFIIKSYSVEFTDVLLTNPVATATTVKIIAGTFAV